MNPKISIIVPVYNCENYLSKCIKSVLNQSFRDFEVIFVDDGSTDRSGGIINEYVTKDSRVRYYYQENSGPSEARNKGISESLGEFLVFIDSDDTVEKNYLELLVTKLIESDSDIICCGYKDVSKFGITNCMDFECDSDNISQHSFMEMVLKGTGGVLWGKIYKKEIITKHHLKMDKHLFMSEDLVFVLLYASYSKKFSTLKEYLYIYNRMNLNSITHKFSINYVQNYITVFKYMEKILKTVEMDQKKINDILLLRIQNLILAIVEDQIRRAKIIGIKNVLSNINSVLSLKYIQEYKVLFSSGKLIYKPFIFFIKKHFLWPMLFYGLYLNLLRNSKHKLIKLIR